MKKPIEFAVVLLERLRPTDWQRTLAWAALAGFTGALATLGFRIGLTAIESFLYGTKGGLVRAADNACITSCLAEPPNARSSRSLTSCFCVDCCEGFAV